MRPRNFESVRWGSYFCHSAIPQLELSLTDVQICYDRFLTRIPSKHETYSGWSTKRAEVDQLDSLTPLLVTGHERNHYSQLMSTPCGLLLWRLYNSMTSGMLFVANKLRDTEARTTCTVPLADWYSSRGCVAIANSPPSLSLEQAQKLHALGIDPTSYMNALPAYIEFVFREIAVFRAFLSAIMGHSPVNMQQFVNMANEASKLLAIRSDLAVKMEWSAYDLSAADYLPEAGFSLNEIIEAGARLWELEVLSGLKVSGPIMREWEKRSIFGVYRPAYEWLLSELGDPMLARLAIDISLMTPVDIACSDGFLGKAAVEDVLPSWRLPKIVNALKDTFWTDDRKEQEVEARYGIATRAGIPTPEQVIQAILPQRLSGKDAWGSDALLYNVPDELSAAEYYSYTEAEVKRAMQIRQSDCLAFVRPETPDVFQPALEFYKDRALFHGSPIVGHSGFPFYLKAYKTIIYNLTLLALFSDGDVSELLSLQDSFSKRMALEGDIADFDNLWDAKALVKSTFAEELYELLKWAVV